MRRLKSILLVDDDETANFLNARLIEKMNIADCLEIATNGKEAMENLQDNKKHNRHPDLIFLDLNMPIMEGYQFLKRYNQLNKLNNTKPVIVILSTLLSKQPNVSSDKYHLVGPLVKPLKEDDINQIMQIYFNTTTTN